MVVVVVSLPKASFSKLQSFFSFPFLHPLFTFPPPLPTHRPSQPPLPFFTTTPPFPRLYLAFFRFRRYLLIPYTLSTSRQFPPPASRQPSPVFSALFIASTFHNMTRTKGKGDGRLVILRNVQLAVRKFLYVLIYKAAYIKEPSRDLLIRSTRMDYSKISRKIHRKCTRVDTLGNNVR
ncbi:hypothetical protein E2C01_021149 [Portunus trituberculatus]|uniref:Uncharacterized protein n=1 Tax=Portunus trituberculatus TaxID=210409 RepID=A0A5B7E473_PORTR|nr:hypothetical protein [Portunus trituberculatus]